MKQNYGFKRVTAGRRSKGQNDGGRKVSASQDSQRKNDPVSQDIKTRSSEDRKSLLQSSFELEISSSESEDECEHKEDNGNAELTITKFDDDDVDDNSDDDDDDDEGEDEEAVTVPNTTNPVPALTQGIEDVRSDQPDVLDVLCSIDDTESTQMVETSTTPQRNGQEGNVKKRAMAGIYSAEKKARISSAPDFDREESFGTESVGSAHNTFARSILGVGTKMKAGNADDTNRTDDVALMRNEISLLRGVLSEVSTGIKQYLDTRLNKTNALQNRTIEELTDLRAIVELSTETKSKKETSKQSDIDIPFFNFAFSDEVMQIVIEKCTILHVTSTSMDYQTRKEKKKTEADVLARGAALAVRIMLFAVNLKKKEGRIMYQTKVGTRFSEFREGIVMTALNAAKQNKFNIFRDEAISDLKVVSDIKPRKVRIPKWLQKDFVTKEHISLARIRSEETADNLKRIETNGKASYNGNPDGELGICAATQLYKRLTNKLNSARGTAKAGFFDELGYLFVSWSSFDCKADQNTMKIRWCDSSSPSLSVKSISDSIPKFNNRIDESSDENQLANIHAKNKKLLSDLISQCGNMNLEVEHEVCIRKHALKSTEKSNKKRAGGKDQSGNPSMSESGSTKSSENAKEDDQFERKDTLVYRVNLIDISCRLLSCYTSQLQFTPPTSLLCSSADSLRCIYSVAVFLKQLLEKVIFILENEGFDEDQMINDARINGVSLGALLPSPARQRNGILTKCVHMFEQVYNFRSITKAKDENVQTSLDSMIEHDCNISGDSGRQTNVIEIE